MREAKPPSGATSLKASSSAERGTRTWSNHSLPLSTPLQPILWPMSSMRTPCVCVGGGGEVVLMGMLGAYSQRLVGWCWWAGAGATGAPQACMLLCAK